MKMIVGYREVIDADIEFLRLALEFCHYRATVFVNPLSRL